MKKTKYVRNRRTRNACAKREKDYFKLWTTGSWPTIHHYGLDVVKMFGPVKQSLERLTDSLRTLMKDIVILSPSGVLPKYEDIMIHGPIWEETERHIMEQSKSRQGRSDLTKVDFHMLDANTLAATFHSPELQKILELKEGDISIRKNN